LSQPIITPDKFLGRAALPPELAGCSLAVVGFCRFHEMTRKLLAEPLPERIFSHLDGAHQFVAPVQTGRIGDSRILALECLYGGPLSATVVEELAHYGIKKVIGYGYAGSLTRDVPVGRIVLADAAIVSDGTSREYLPDTRFAHPDRELVRHLCECAVKSNVAVHRGTVWTTDAIYREYPERIAQWRRAGADVVNMDTAHFYAVSQVVGISAVYVCVVSDCVEGPAWEDGFARVKQAMSDLQDVVVDVLAEISKEA
jgi:uridine phosphorylase